MSRSARLGRAGETVALLWLLARGYRLRDRRWGGRGGELDLVMERRGLLVFVEVRTRSGPGFGGALASVDRTKRERIVRTAAAYLTRHALWDRPCRFDVVAIERTGSWLPWRLRHVPGAFEPGPLRPG